MQREPVQQDPLGPRERAETINKVTQRNRARNELRGQPGLREEEETRQGVRNKTRNKNQALAAAQGVRGGCGAEESKPTLGSHAALPQHTRAAPRSARRSAKTHVAVAQPPPAPAQPCAQSAPQALPATRCGRTRGTVPAGAGAAPTGSCPVPRTLV